MLPEKTHSCDVNAYVGVIIINHNFIKSISSYCFLALTYMWNIKYPVWLYLQRTTQNFLIRPFFNYKQFQCVLYSHVCKVHQISFKYCANVYLGVKTYPFTWN